MRSISLDLIRVTEAGAIAASKFIGAGKEKKLELDGAATDKMRERLNDMYWSAMVVIGEGEKDEAPGLFNGEPLGQYHTDPNYDIAIDPVEGTNLTALGKPGAISIIAVSRARDMMVPDNFYMYKIAYDKRVKTYLWKWYRKQVMHKESIENQIYILASALKKSVGEVTVCCLDRPRNNFIMEEARRVGCKLKLISDGDVNACVAACSATNHTIDAYMGIGGAPEGIISAAAAKCLGGGLEGLEVNVFKSDPTDWFRGETFYTQDDLIKGECVLAATGITGGPLLKGVTTGPEGLQTHSVFMRSESGTVRHISTNHGN